MKGFLFRLIITALGLWAAATIVPGVSITGVGNRSSRPCCWVS